MMFDIDGETFSFDLVLDGGRCVTVTGTVTTHPMGHRCGSTIHWDYSELDRTLDRAALAALSHRQDVSE